MLRNLIYSIMTDTAKGFWAAPFKFLLCLGEALYKMYLRILLTGYKIRFFIPYRPDAKAISIGNLTLGGTGKTEACIMLNNLLEAKEKKTAILIRGYGIDESRMLEEELPHTPILIGRNRIRNSRRAFYEFGVDTIILDDAFQHYRLDRDLNIVLVDASNPFGNGRLIPRGILRESISELRRADIVIITKVDFREDNLSFIYGAICKFFDRENILEAVYRPLCLYNISKPSEKLNLETIKTKNICMLSSIANPGYFRRKLEGCGSNIELDFIYPDHYNYKDGDFLEIFGECKFFKIDYIVTTKKDAVKIKKLGLSGIDIPILVLEIEFHIVKNKELLLARLDNLCSV